MCSVLAVDHPTKGQVFFGHWRLIETSRTPPDIFVCVNNVQLAKWMMPWVLKLCDSGCALTCYVHNQLWINQISKPAAQVNIPTFLVFVTMNYEHANSPRPWDCGLSFLLYSVFMILYSHQNGSQTHYSYIRMAHLWTSWCLTQQALWSFAVVLASLEGSVCPSHLKDALPACFIVEGVWSYLLLYKIVFLSGIHLK